MRQLSYKLGPAQYERNGAALVRISENALKSAVFFGVPAPDVEGGISYGGTGTLIGWMEPNLNTAYVVTCRHVALALNNFGDTGFFIRVNKRDGTAFAIPVEKWTGVFLQTHRLIWLRSGS